MSANIKAINSIICSCLLTLCFTSHSLLADVKKPGQHGIAMHGVLKYSENFTHFDYNDPAAPKGGKITIGLQGTFTSLNPLNIRGGAGAGVRGYVYESLLARALDEPFSLYGLIAERIEMPEDRSSITFHLNKKARFSDGHPLTAKDVVFSLNLLKNHGRPNHRTYYAKVTKTEILNDHVVKFTFNSEGDQEIPLIMGLMPILPSHSMTEQKFRETSFAPPVGSGPYIVSEVDPGKEIHYQLNPDYWARDLNVNRGRFNFNQVIYAYYRDSNTLFEAFKNGLHDLYYEGNPGKWKTSYNFRAIEDERVMKKEFPLKIPSGMRALVFNTRRPLFSDQRVRRALNYMFNFEDLNRKLFHELYTRTESYFDRSALTSKGHPADSIEDKILPPSFKTDHPELYKGTYRFPVNQGKSLNRGNIRRAIRLLKEAGYVLKEGQLLNSKTGQPFTFEIMTITKSQEALLLNFIENLKLIGVRAALRQVDATQYQKRKATFDFDMFENSWSGSLSPGNEQLFRWSTKQANTEGSYNFAGVSDPAVDSAIAALLAAKTPDKFTSSVRALDRLLLSGDYVIPLYHLKSQWLAHWAYLGHPDTGSNYGTVIDSWWDKRTRKAQKIQHP